MFSVVRRASQNPSTQVPRFSEWDPVQLMENLLRFEPFADLAPARRGTNDQTFLPRFDVKETKDAFLFTADLPGVREQDVDISLTGNRLTISGHRGQEDQKEGDNYYMVERSYGSFTRSFTLPDSANAEATTASMNDGVLTLHLPKRVESQPRRVSVNAKKGEGGNGSAYPGQTGTATAASKKAQS